MALVVGTGVIRHRFWGHQRQPAHSLEDGGRRLVGALTDPSLRSGVFYASAATTLTGPVIDQATIMPELGDAAVQDHAMQAIGRLVT
ncbi:MAG TPA: hypothetical protein VH084_21000 [Mycobacterium sp.]|jgi:hypothetical protein|nr:hypothetical protein [Mycobacterium sp.]